MNENYSGIFNLTGHQNDVLIFTDRQNSEKEKWQKISFSKAQTDKLEEAFIANEFLTHEMLSYLSETLSIEQYRIQLWFENKRNEEYTTNRKLWGPPKYFVDQYGYAKVPPPRNVASPTNACVPAAGLAICGHCSYFADHSIPAPPPTGAWRDAIDRNREHAALGTGGNGNGPSGMYPAVSDVMNINVGIAGIYSGASTSGFNGVNSGASTSGFNGVNSGASTSGFNGGFDGIDGGTGGGCYVNIHPSGSVYAKIHPSASTYTKIHPSGGEYTKISGAGCSYTKISATGSSYTEISAAGSRYTEISPSGSSYTAIGATGSGFTTQLNAAGGVGYTANIGLVGNDGRDDANSAADNDRCGPRSLAEEAAAAAGRAAGIAARSTTGAAAAAAALVAASWSASRLQVPPPVLPTFLDPVDRPPSRRRRGDRKRRGRPFAALSSIPPEYRHIVKELLTSGQAAYQRYVENAVHGSSLPV